MRTFLVSLTILCIGSLVSGKNLFNCSQNSTRGGVCVLQSEICCQSYKDSECKKELGQNRDVFAPRLLFSPNSFLVDYRPGLPSLVCIEHLHVPRGVAIRGNDIRGLYLEVYVWNSRQVREIMFSSGTTVFPGNVTRSSLENGLFCLELELSEEQLARESNTLTFLMVPLPASSLNREPAVYSSGPSRSKFIPACNITNVDIYITNCLTWNKHIWPGKSCIRENVVRPEPMRPLKEIANPPFSDEARRIQTPSLGSGNDTALFWRLWAVISTTIAVCLLVALMIILAGGAVTMKKIRGHYKKKFSKTADTSNFLSDGHIAADDGSGRRIRRDFDLESQWLRLQDRILSILSNAPSQQAMDGGENLNDSPEIAQKNDEKNHLDNSVRFNDTTLQQRSKDVQSTNQNDRKDFEAANETRPGQSSSSVQTKVSCC